MRRSELVAEGMILTPSKKQIHHLNTAFDARESACDFIIKSLNSGLRDMFSLKRLYNQIEMGYQFRNTGTATQEAFHVAYVKLKNSEGIDGLLSGRYFHHTLFAIKSNAIKYNKVVGWINLSEDIDENFDGSYLKIYEEGGLYLADLYGYRKEAS